MTPYEQWLQIISSVEKSEGGNKDRIIGALAQQVLTANETIEVKNKIIAKLQARITEINESRMSAIENGK